MPDDFWSRRIDISCPHCRQTFKVRLRKLQFGAGLVCRRCRYEFDAAPNSDLREVQVALAQVRKLEAQWRAGALREESFQSEVFSNDSTDSLIAT
ncbi:hypothetical protein DC522_11875 [Microvirga sp. KLBC 81]|uniref:hypothetical protein n=1 Tax=Microvirga sp. KLBC 81 TaxID=1862707 RepID=UPI000D507B7E|nr:hypothetical protein [Microvirga sp. KLBC 81]PVE24176.1 hypothetical protein DC522_11875 [Microvirga sp. KLBC 81]